MVEVPSSNLGSPTKFKKAASSDAAFLFPARSQRFTELLPAQLTAETTVSAGILGLV